VATAYADHIDHSAAHAEETVDAENQRHSRYRMVGNNHHGGDERYKGSSLNTACAFEVSTATPKISELLEKS